MKNSLIAFTIVLCIVGCKQAADQTTTAPESKTLRHTPKLEDGRYNVAFLIMNGTFNTEFTAPFDIFQHTQYRPGIKQMNVFTVANTLSPVTTFEGVRLLPDFDYTQDTLPKIDILVVPSAEHHLDTDLQDSLMIQFVRRVSKDALFVTSHCDGAFVLAQSGVLNDVVSTTFPSDVDRYRALFPQLDVREHILFVHDRKFITSAGGARSFDAALYLAEILYGKEIARSLAGGLVIDWDLEKVPHLVMPTALNLAVAQED
jgi:transcriptional regulator GlxA family with amidase domain